MSRLLELKNEMVNLEFSEYHFFDDVLSDMKLTPADIEIPVPRYFTQVDAALQFTPFHTRLHLTMAS